MTTHDPVNHPSHYTQSGDIECIDAIKAALTGESDPFIGYLRGNAIKYLWRADLKGGVADLPMLIIGAKGGEVRDVRVWQPKGKSAWAEGGLENVRELVKLGGDPVYREGVVTDNGNIIIDVFNMQITNPVELERQINAIVGVVTNGLFAARPADLLLLGTPEGVKTLSK